MKLLTRRNGIAIARAFRRAVMSRKLPVERVVIYGSVARGEAREHSDLDIAVICKPFKASRHEENMVLRRLCWDIDARIEPIALHDDDFGKPYFPIPYAVEKDGVEVQ